MPRYEQFNKTPEDVTLMNTYDGYVKARFVQSAQKVMEESVMTLNTVTTPEVTFRPTTPTAPSAGGRQERCSHLLTLRHSVGWSYRGRCTLENTSSA